MTKLYKTLSYFFKKNNNFMVIAATKKREGTETHPLLVYLIIRADNIRPYIERYLIFYRSSRTPTPTNALLIFCRAGWSHLSARSVLLLCRGVHRTPSPRRYDIFTQNYQYYIPCRNRTKSLLHEYAVLHPAGLHSPVPCL